MAFTLTAQDVAWLTALIRGEPVAEGIPGYRSLSGFGNNLANPTFGAADNPFIRITDARYGAFNTSIGTNGLGNFDINPIFTGLDPRAISNVIGQQEANLPKAASGANLLFSAFGQYVDHGLDFLAKGKSGTVLIGAPGVTPAPGSNNPADLTRGTVVGFDENLLPQHLNKTANFVEQNQAYGSNDLVGIFLREVDGTGGITANLAVGGRDPSSPDFSLLPTLRELILQHWENNTLFSSGNFSQTFQQVYPTLVQNGVIDAAVAKELYSDFMNTGQQLLIDLNPFISPLDHIVAGDGRVNENVTLTAIHTIWARNHNFHVENLSSVGFTGTPEELFQAAKLINETEYQRVVFTEFTDVTATTRTSTRPSPTSSLRQPIGSVTPSSPRQSRLWMLTARSPTSLCSMPSSTRRTTGSSSSTGNLSRPRYSHSSAMCLNRVMSRSALVPFSRGSASRRQKRRT